MKFRVLGAFALVCALAACATPYGKQGLTGGYVEKELQPGIWRVVFDGNGYTSAETVQTYWLYRCAEITLGHGYQGFEILSDMRLSSLSLLGAARDDRNECGSAPVYIPMYVDTSPKPAIGGDIRLLKGPITERPPKVFDAAKLKAILDPLVTGKTCPDGSTRSMGNVCPHVHTYLLPLDDPLRQQSTASPAQPAAAGAPGTAPPLKPAS